jgi:Flp pilus assembly protein TadB
MTTIDVALLCRTIENALRAGFSLRQALERAASDFAHPTLTEVARQAKDGAALDGLFDEWGSHEPDIALLAGAVRLQLEAGGNLADRLGNLGAILERRPATTAAAPTE